MTPDQREGEIRRRAFRFRALSARQRFALPAHEYAHHADCDFLVELVDQLRRVIAHAPTASSLPAMPVAPAVPEALRGATLPTAPKIPAVDLPWSDPANRG